MYPLHFHFHRPPSYIVLLSSRHMPIPLQPHFLDFSARPAQYTMDMIFSARQMQSICREQGRVLFLACKYTLPKRLTLQTEKPYYWHASHDSDIRLNLSTSPGNYTKAWRVVYYISENNQHGANNGCMIAPTLFSILLVASAYHK